MVDLSVSVQAGSYNIQTKTNAEHEVMKKALYMSRVVDKIKFIGYHAMLSSHKLTWKEIYYDL